MEISGKGRLDAVQGLAQLSIPPPENPAKRNRKRHHQPRQQNRHRSHLLPQAHPLQHVSRASHRSPPSAAAPAPPAESPPETATPKRTSPTKSTSAASPGSSILKPPPVVFAREATSSPSAENASEVIRHRIPSSTSDPRNGTPNTTRVNVKNAATSISSITSRDSRNEARYCHFGIGDATIRFSSFFCRASTIEKPKPPHRRPHQVHPQQSRHHKVDIPRPRLMHQLVVGRTASCRPAAVCTARSASSRAVRASGFVSSYLYATPSGL
jgi:hypothetical protein